MPCSGTSDCASSRCASPEQSTPRIKRQLASVCRNVFKKSTTHYISLSAVQRKLRAVYKLPLSVMWVSGHHSRSVRGRLRKEISAYVPLVGPRAAMKSFVAFPCRSLVRDPFAHPNQAMVKLVLYVKRRGHVGVRDLIDNVVRYQISWQYYSIWHISWHRGLSLPTQSSPSPQQFTYLLCVCISRLFAS